VEIKRQISIKLHDTGIRNHPAYIGLYSAKKDRIDLLTLDYAKHQCARQQPFGMPMNPALDTSFVAHEVAHAIADQNFANRDASLLAHEYLAYVAQLMTMTSGLQAKILQRYDLEPFASLEHMSLTYYGLNPNAFGVKAFLHYQSLPEQSQFIQDLLSGSIKPIIREAEWW